MRAETGKGRVCGGADECVDYAQEANDPEASRMRYRSMADETHGHLICILENSGCPIKIFGRVTIDRSSPKELKQKRNEVLLL